MAIRDAFKITRKTFFNPSGWIGFNELRTYARIIGANIKDLRTLPQPEHTETFTEAMQRLNVTEEDVKATGDRYLLYSVFFVALAAFAFAIGFVFLLGVGTFAAFILALACMTILLACAFRYHFWYFQIKHRKLGCTFDEWWRGTPSADKDTTDGN